MLLGRLIKDALAGQGQFVADIAARDLALAARVNDAAARKGMTPEAYVGEAVRSFLAEDDAEAWTTVTSALQARGPEAGVSFLGAVVRRRLRLDGA
jgi:hypothetical protein